MHSCAFTKNVAIADADVAGSAGVCDILRLVANYYIGVKDVASSDLSITENRDVSDQTAAAAQPYATVEQAEGSNLDTVAQFNITLDYRGRMNARTAGRGYRVVGLSIS